MTTTNFKATSQRLELIELDKCVPTNYQRETKKGQVSDITADFNEAQLGVLTVSLRDGNYHIVDGLHRSKALKACGYTHALAIILTEMTYEQEAEFFRKQRENSRPINTFDDFTAGLEGKNERCVKINDILKAHNFQVKRGNNFYYIASIGALVTIAEYYGYIVLEDTLLLLANTWAGIPNATCRECLLGMAEFVSRYGLCDFAERMRNNYALVWYEYTEAMRLRGATTATLARKKFCRVLVKSYNKGLAGGSKKRLVWEENNED